MKPPTPATVRNLPHTIALCDETTSEAEQREIAERLGIAHFLPERQAELPLMARVKRRQGQQEVKG